MIVWNVWVPVNQNTIECDMLSYDSNSDQRMVKKVQIFDVPPITANREREREIHSLFERCRSSQRLMSSVQSRVDFLSGWRSLKQEWNASQMPAIFTCINHIVKNSADRINQPSVIDIRHVIFHLKQKNRFDYLHSHHSCEKWFDICCC